MNARLFYLLAADSILLAHVLFVVFVVFGLVLIIAGKLMSWEWVHNTWFRLAHLAAISVVLLQSWLGAICPLTLWEQALRERAGEASYPGAFVAHWLEHILYYRAPDWIFQLAYSLFALSVLACWVWVRPRKFAKRCN